VLVAGTFQINFKTPLEREEERKMLQPVCFTPLFPRFPFTLSLPTIPLLFPLLLFSFSQVLCRITNARSKRKLMVLSVTVIISPLLVLPLYFSTPSSHPPIHFPFFIKNLRIACEERTSTRDNTN
jgi:hypothetical protein